MQQIYSSYLIILYINKILENKITITVDNCKYLGLFFDNQGVRNHEIRCLVFKFYTIGQKYKSNYKINL